MLHCQALLLQILLLAAAFIELIYYLQQIIVFLFILVNQCIMNSQLKVLMQKMRFVN